MTNYIKVKPRVSVVIPTFNSSRTLRRAIDSVLSQTFQEFEILICDDASTDTTLNVAYSYAKKDWRIRVLALEVNQGAAASRNLGMKNAQGEYIAFLDSDDEWLPDKINRQIKRMDQEPQHVGICICGAGIIVNENEKSVKRFKPNKRMEDCTYKKMVLGKIYFLTPVLMFRKLCLEKCGMMVPEMRRNQDAEFLLRILRCYKLVVIPEVLATIHLVVSGKRKKVYDRAKRAYPYWERHVNEIREDFGVLVSILFKCKKRTDLLNLAIREQRWREAFFCLIERLRLLPALFPKEVISLMKSLCCLFLKH